ncbi:hypothetical protein HNV03_11445 [Empedobacter stercoris]|nr:hypothetical protein HNV03_11445 [Empedobacter stercoris]
MSKKSINKMLFKTGIGLLSLSILMLIYAIAMFSARGNYSKFEIKLSEISLVFWLPIFCLGILILIISFVLITIKKQKSSNQ